MVKCHVCKLSAAGGWICGVPPASDKLKLGLCKEHDTPANRETVLHAWEAMMQQAIDQAMATAREAAKPPVRYELRLYYLDGGVRTFECSAYDVSSDRQLLVTEKDKKVAYHPLEHIRRFEVEELPGEGEKE